MSCSFKILRRPAASRLLRDAGQSRSAQYLRVAMMGRSPVSHSGLQGPSCDRRLAPGQTVRLQPGLVLRSDIASSAINLGRISPADIARTTNPAVEASTAISSSACCLAAGSELHDRLQARGGLEHVDAWDQGHDAGEGGSAERKAQPVREEGHRRPSHQRRAERSRDEAEARLQQPPAQRMGSHPRGNR